MRRAQIAVPVLALLLASFHFPLPVTAEEGEAAAIRAVVDSAYVQGIHNEQDGERIRAGFHQSFVMFIRTDDGVRQVTRDEWIERIEASRERGDRQARPEATAEITVLDQTGHAAVAKVDVFRDGKHLFTDFMSLYRFDDGWKLVGKIFHSHG